MKIYDISLPLDSGTLIYPGNPEMSIEAYRSVPEYPTNLSKITFGSHTGTHVDASRHVDNDAPGVDKINLEGYDKLTEEEKSFLYNASQKLANKDEKN